MCLSTRGHLYINYLDTAAVHRAYIKAAVCLQQHPIAPIEQIADQERSFCLQHWFAARNFHQGTVIFRNLSDYINNCQFFAFIVGILCIAISTPKIASGEPYKNTGIPRPRRFTLNTVKNLIYFQISSPLMKRIRYLPFLLIAFSETHNQIYY